jgi:hypothetical protein
MQRYCVFTGVKSLTKYYFNAACIFSKIYFHFVRVKQRMLAGRPMQYFRHDFDEENQIEDRWIMSKLFFKASFVKR